MEFYLLLKSIELWLNSSHNLQKANLSYYELTKLLIFQMLVLQNIILTYIFKKFTFLTHTNSFLILFYQDGFIDINEFERLIDLRYYYNDMYKKFQQLDKNNDKRISFLEFKKGHEIIGLEASTSEELKKEFNKIDINHGGYILFDEVRIVFRTVKYSQSTCTQD